MKEEFRMICDYMENCMRDMAHDREHVWRVLTAAVDIARHVDEKPDFRILTAACLLHDVGRQEENIDPTLDHAAVGAEKAYRFLTGIGWTEEDAGQVRDCIAAHRYRSGQPPQSIEARILFDADKLDVTGAMGVARTLMYEGAHNEPLYLLHPDGTLSEGDLPGEESFLHEYCFKLSKLDRAFSPIMPVGLLHVGWRRQRISITHCGKKSAKAVNCAGSFSSSFQSKAVRFLSPVILHKS